MLIPNFTLLRQHELKDKDGKFQHFTLSAVYFAGLANIYFWSGMTKTDFKDYKDYEGFWGWKEPDEGPGANCVALKVDGSLEWYDFKCDAKLRPLCVA